MNFASPAWLVALRVHTARLEAEVAGLVEDGVVQFDPSDPLPRLKLSEYVPTVPL